MYRGVELICVVLSLLLYCSPVHSAPRKNDDVELSPENCNLNPADGSPAYCTRNVLDSYTPDPNVKATPIPKATPSKKSAKRTTKHAKTDHTHAHATRTHAPTKTKHSGPHHTACELDNDPDNGIGYHCVCSSGDSYVSVDTAREKSLTSGELYDPCPWSTIPSKKEAKPFKKHPPPRQTGGKKFFTETVDQKIIACPRSVVSKSSGYEVTHCVGKSVTVGTLPTHSVQIGNRKQNVGTLTGEELYTSVSNALTSICPKPTDGPTSCKTSSAWIHKIIYVEPASGPLDGKLEVYVDSSKYHNNAMRQALIKAAAITAQHSTNRSNCEEKIWTVDDFAIGGTPAPSSKQLMCNAAAFAGVQRYNGMNDHPGPTDWLDAAWLFHTQRGESAADDSFFSCEMIVSAVRSALAMLGPEFAVAGFDDGTFVAICEEAMKKTFEDKD